MLHALVVLLLLGAEPARGLEQGTLVSYRGSVSPVDPQGNPTDPEKTFDLTMLVTQRDAKAAQVYWQVDENGRGGWSWAERVGMWNTADASSAAAPSLLYERDEATSVIPLLGPVMEVPVTLATEESWTTGDLTSRVIGKTELDGKPAWQIDIEARYGRKRTVWLGLDGQKILGYDERVFMGQGVEYRLRVRLQSETTPEKPQLERLSGAFAAVVKLREALARPQRTETTNWMPEQLAVLAKELPATEEAARTTLLESIVRTATRDLASQRDRDAELERIATDQIGRKVADFELHGSGGEKLTQEDLLGQITVLHFWDYRDEPLKEPYGQVGYLDFLYDRNKADVRVYGVAVNGLLAAEETHALAARSVRKLKSFMNLSYPVLLDRGELLKQFGDPRLVGGSLPLFVVIGPDGQVRHYHTGHYEVDRDLGLVELSKALSKLRAK